MPLGKPNETTAICQDMKPREATPVQYSTRTFTALVLLVQFLGVGSVVMTVMWLENNGGFAWQTDLSLEFNFHPLFLIIGLVFLQGNAILAYRVFRYSNKVVIKTVHACLLGGALIFSSLGLKAVFDGHNLASPPRASLKSLHSLVGIITVVMFALQWLLGFVSYLYPKTEPGARRALMPFHVFFGVVILWLSIVTSLMGFAESKNETLMKCLGLMIISFAVLVTYMLNRTEYKRPAETQEHLPLA